jgi:hypothetical protein
VERPRFPHRDYEHASRYGFEDWLEPLARGEPWTSRIKKYVGDRKGIKPLTRGGSEQSAAFTAERAHEGQRSLRASTRGAGPAFEPLLFGFGAERRLERRPLATGLAVHLALFPEELGPDARAVVELELSEHAPRADRTGFEVERVRYELAPGAAGAPRRDGARYVVPVACEPGRWNELVLRATDDAVRGFPESPGEDNSLVGLSFGLEARNGARATACFDELVLEQARSGEPVFARQAELIRAVGALYPALVQLQGLEISFEGRHLNLFCEDTPVPDYDALAEGCPRDAAEPELLDQRAFRERVSAWALAETHARGGLVSYNHPFGATFEENEKPRTNEEELAILLKNRADGADILEVGYRDRGGATLADHLWLWDHAALAGLRLVGTGVSDSHGGAENRWRGSPNNFVSWIYASAPDKPHLIAGLRAGRVFFGDLERFHGTLDMVLDSGERMGATVVGTRATAEVELRASGTRPGQSVVVVESGAATRTYPVTGPEFRAAHALTLPADGPAFVRFELRDATGAIALSNPIHFLRPGADARGR